MRSRDPLDFKFCSICLTKLVGLPNGRADERAPDMLERLVCGVPNRSFVLFMDRFATMVEVLPIDMLLEGIGLLWIICRRTRWGPRPDREFLDALVHSKTLFSALFSRFTYDEDTGSIQPGEEIDSLFMDSMQLTLVCMDRLGDRGATSRETKAFMETCCHAGLFEAFERVLVHHREMIKDAPGEQISFQQKSPWAQHFLSRHNLRSREGVLLPHWGSPIRATIHSPPTPASSSLASIIGSRIRSGSTISPRPSG